MTAEVSSGSGRARPQSGGFRTFLSWLKREDRLQERSSSVESVNSSGSDRTVTSFAFFEPAYYQSHHREPVTVPPPGPPTDSYRKRIQDRNLRLHLDRDLTLCRKYHLTADPSNYEGSSLPNVRHDREDRAIRATSVCLQRRAPYVPGKRHAPAPPARASSLGPMTTQSIKRIRKRQAPQPPIVNTPLIKENIELKDNRTFNLSGSSNSETNNNIYKKGVKSNMGENFKRNPSDRSFLKQIFEGKKKISVFDPVAVRLLPSISELDRQAAEIIQMKLRNEKMKDNATNMETMNSPWRMADHPIEKTVHNKEVIGSTSTAEKEDLKKILKEMKDSLPKRPKSTKDSTNSDVTKPSTSNSNCEKPGTSALDNISKWHWSPLISETNKMPLINISLLNSDNSKNSKLNNVKNGLQKSELQVDTTTNIDKRLDSKQSIPLASNKTIVSINVVSKKTSLNNVENVSLKPHEKNSIDEASNLVKNVTNVNSITYDKNNILNDQVSLQLPTKVEKDIEKENNKTEKEKTKIDKDLPNNLLPKYSKMQSPALLSVGNSITKDKEIQIKTNHKPTGSQITTDNINIVKPSKNLEKNNVKLEQTHKYLITELEECILKGDENGAAKAATQLAQLRVNRLGLSSLFNKDLSGNTGINETMNKESGAIVNTPDICHVRKQTPKKETSSNSPNNKVDLPIVTSPPRRRSNSIPDVIPSTSIENKKEQTDGNAIDNKCDANTKLIKGDVKALAGSSFSKRVNFSKPVVKKINVNASTSNNEIISRENLVRIEVWVEDRKEVRGPVGICVSRDWDLTRLRRQAEITLGLPMSRQRWIVGNKLCSDDKAHIEDLAGTDFKAPFYLCLIESELNKKVSQEDLKEAQILEETVQVEVKTQNVYKELMELEQQALVINVEEFECGVCLERCAAGRGAVLRDCVHSFCRDCLADAVRHCQDPQVSCPSGGCASRLQEREIRALVSAAEFERWLARGLAAAESGTRGSFHCRTPDCAAWALVGPGVTTFPCGRCGVTSCVTCQAVHEGMTCAEYRSIEAQKVAKLALEGKVEDEGTRALLDTLIEKGEALPCPECNAIITKKWGCDWVRCSACKTEICWITRGRRWGPMGRGDTSAGCRCGVDGKRCHPACAYCH